MIRFFFSFLFYVLFSGDLSAHAATTRITCANFTVNETSKAGIYQTKAMARTARDEIEIDCERTLRKAKDSCARGTPWTWEYSWVSHTAA